MALFPLGDLLSKLKDGITKALNVRGEVDITGSNVQLPVEIQGKYTKTETTHSALTIAPGAWSQGAWLESNGAEKIAVTASMSGGTGMTVAVDFSHDGSTQAMSSTLYDNTGTTIGTEQTILAKYFRVSIRNKDASVPKTTNAWSYFKY